jgi:DNA-binding transcriptional LysR family regulator
MCSRRASAPRFGVVFKEHGIDHLASPKELDKQILPRQDCRIALNFCGLILQKCRQEMPMNWNDLRYVLAISRRGTLAAAARLLGVDNTTVARRLAAIQETIGARLYERLADGTLQLTASGQRAALHAERIEREIGALDAALSDADNIVSGTVRVTSVPIIVNRVLVPAAQILHKRHPALQLELIGESRDLSLTRREADLALRLARPKTGGTKVTARRVGTVRYDVYASASYSAREAKALPWITYDEAMAHLPQARWIAAAAAMRNGGKIGAVRVNDAETVLETVIAGLGRSLLPRVIADRDSRLQRVGAEQRTSALTRELWLLTHSELRRLARIEVVAEWIAQIAPR